MLLTEDSSRLGVFYIIFCFNVCCLSSLFTACILSNQAYSSSQTNHHHL